MKEDKKVIERQAYRRDHLKFKKKQSIKQPKKVHTKKPNQSNPNKQPQLYIPSQKLL